MQRRRRLRLRELTIAVVLALVAAVLLWLLRRDDAAPATASHAPDTAPVATAHAAPAARAPTALPTVIIPGPETGAPGIATDDPLTAFKKQNVYPPTSRPLSADQADLLRPNQRHEAPRSTEQADGTEYLFTADRYFVVGAETLTPTLEVRRKGASIPVHVSEAFVAVLDPKATADAPRYPYTVGAPFSPSTIPGVRRQIALGMFVAFDVDGHPQRARFDFQYTPEAGIPARFTGVFTESIVAGSLVVRAGVDVMTAGSFLVDCNLFDASDRPLVWSHANVELARGPQTVELVFFGKALVDQKASGALHLGQLRGARFAPGQDPDVEQMPAFPGTFTTRAYAADDFSEAEYDSDHKRQMIQLLEEQQARGAHQGAAH